MSIRTSARPGLTALADDTLLDRLRALARRERHVTLDILSHLNEVERRRLHLKRGYPSMFAYCTECLRYSASAAGRRIQTARCIRRFPMIERMLHGGEVNLSTISRVARVLDASNYREVLNRIRGKSQREVDAIVAELAPGERVPRDSVRTVCVRPAQLPALPDSARPSPAQTTASCLLGPRAGADSSVATVDSVAAGSTPTNHTPACAYSRSGSDLSKERESEEHAAPSPGCGPEAGGQTERPVPTVDTRVLIRFAAKPGFMKKVERVRALLAFRLRAGASLEEVFAAVMDEFVDAHCPARRRERRQLRERRKTPVAAKAAPEAGQGTAPQRPEPRPALRRAEPPPAQRSRSKRSRHIPAAIRDDVFVRDRGRCAFVGPDGRRCGSTMHLQVDHRTPFALGGPHSPSNLRVLCAAHNRLEAERLLGPDSMVPRRRHRGRGEGR